MRALRRTRESRAADGLRAGRPETRVPANVITGLMPSQTRDCHGTQRAERASGRQRRGAIEGVPDQFRRPVQCDQERLQQRQHFRRRRRRQVRAPVRGSPIFERFAFDLAGRTPHRHGAGETDPSAVRMKSRQEYREYPLGRYRCARGRGACHVSSYNSRTVPASCDASLFPKTCPPRPGGVALVPRRDRHTAPCRGITCGAGAMSADVWRRGNCN